LENSIFTKKIHLFLTVWLLLIIPVINISLYFLFYKVTLNNELDRLGLQAKHIAESVTLSTDKNNLAEPFKAHLPVNGMIRVIDKDSNGILTVTKETELLNIKPVFNRSQTTDVKLINEVQYAVAYFPMIWKDGNVVTLEVMESLASIQESMRVLKLVLIVASLVVLISLFPLIFSRKNTK